MNKELLNEIMDCQCLQSIIERDKLRHTLDEDRLGARTIQTPTEHSNIRMYCFTSYREKIIDTEYVNNRVVKDMIERDYHGLPFLHCPICGTKTKVDIPDNSFYSKFQK